MHIIRLTLVVLYFILVGLAFAGQDAARLLATEPSACDSVAVSAHQNIVSEIEKAEATKNFDLIQAAYDEARESLLEHYESCSTAVLYVSKLVWLDIAAGEFGIAIDHADAGLDANPGDPYLLMSKAEVLLRIEREEEAFALMRDARSKARNDLGVFYNCCSYLIERRQYNEALSVCSETIDICEKSSPPNCKDALPWAYTFRASAYAGLGNDVMASSDVGYAQDLGLETPWLWRAELSEEKHRKNSK